MTDTWRDLRALLFLDRMTWKNRWRGIIAHPGRAAWHLTEALLFLAIAFGPALLTTRGRPRPVVPAATVEPYIGAIVFALLTVTLVWTLGSAITKYAPTCFTPADAHLVFTSRISARTIYLYALLRGFGQRLIGAVVMLAPFAGIAVAIRLPLAWGRFGYSVAGLVAYLLFLEGSGFLAFKLNKRFRFEPVLRVGLAVFALAAIGGWAWSVIGSHAAGAGILTALGDPRLAWLPVAGWTKALVLAPLTVSPALPWLLAGTLLAALLTLIAAVVLAADYYEEAIQSLDEVRRLRASVEQGQLSVKPAPRRAVSLGWEGRGAAAFLWKELLVAKRHRNWGFIALKYALLIGAGTAVAWFVRKESVGELAGIYLAEGIMLGPLSGIVPAGLAYEMKHHYLYLLPGRVRDKILSTNLWLICKSVLRNAALIAPTLFIGQAGPLDSLGLFLALVALDTSRVFDRVLLRILLPWQKATSPLLQYIEIVIELLLLAPGLIAAVVAYLTLHSWAMTLAAFAAGGFLASWCVLLLSERFFARLELKE